MNDIDIKLNAKADFDPVVKEGAGVVATLNKGIAKIFSALLGPWIAERERNARLIAEQTEIECQALRNNQMSYVEGKLIPYQPPAQLPDAYQQLHALNHGADALRLKAAMDVAATKFYDIPESDVSDEPIPQTFFNHWRREAEMIDEADIRERWAQLLVQETKKPGTVSVRTLEVVARMTRDEAAIFERARQGIFNDMLLTEQKNGHALSCSYGDCLILSDAGLITLPSAQEKVDRGAQSAFEHVFADERVLLLIESANFTLNGYVLTRAGMEMVNALRIGLTKASINKIAKRISEWNKSAMVSLHEITGETTDGHWSYRREPFEVFGPKKEGAK